ncbi:hypothetical protein [Anabaena azotica]|uniref:Uncharacterized protein n=1 Tax=Anabaena azotica FACHB-119 TaxID=947527 RepID=A0ABR8D2J2_9NOST|nr:hypothetical protein [Anabaena azotica]MBD2500495.1 hypothetical protein [Anabaena azotica FACHB-119]
MQTIDLGLQGKARIWQDEPFVFPGNYRPIYYPIVEERIETTLNDTKTGILSQTEVMIEILAPLGARFLYGCLGAMFMPNNSGKLVLTVCISTESEPQLDNSLASSLDVVRNGIIEEYASSIFEGAKLKLQENGISNIFGSGEVYFRWGAFGEIGSSIAFFHDLAYAVIQLMVNDKGQSDNIKSPVKNFLEQSLSTANNN